MHGEMLEGSRGLELFGEVLGGRRAFELLFLLLEGGKAGKLRVSLLSSGSWDGGGGSRTRGSVFGGSWDLKLLGELVEDGRGLEFLCGWLEGGRAGEWAGGRAFKLLVLLLYGRNRWGGVELGRVTGVFGGNFGV